MRRFFIIAAAAAAIVGGLAVIAGALDPARPPVGTGETLVFVTAGEYATATDARAAAERFDFGELQGFSVVPSAMLEGLAAGRWLLASAFRTERGASEFEELARAAGATSLRRVVARYLGTAPVGLGQEPAPDGSGPLLTPLPRPPGTG